MTNDVCCSFAWFSSQSALLPLSTMHFYDIWLHFTQDCKEYYYSSRSSWRENEREAASTKPMEFGMRIFQSSKNTKQCTKCLETFKYVSIKKNPLSFAEFFLCQENETFLNFQLLWNMHGNFEGLRSITTFGLPRIHKIHKIKKIVKFTEKKNHKIKKTVKFTKNLKIT